MFFDLQNATTLWFQVKINWYRLWYSANLFNFWPSYTTAFKNKKSLLKIGQIWKKLTFWNFQGKNLKNWTGNQNSAVYKIFWFWNTGTRPSISKLCRFLKPSLSCEGENWTHFQLHRKSHIFENRSYLELTIYRAYKKVS